jgi:hypothetical protein
MRGKRAKHLRHLASLAAPDAPETLYQTVRFKKVIRDALGKPVIANMTRVSLGHCQRKLYRELKTAWKTKALMV